MSGKRFSAPSYNASVLAEMFSDYMRKGPMRNVRIGPGESNRLDLHGDSLLMTYYGIPQVVHFGNKQIIPSPGNFDRTSYSFGVLTPYDNILRHGTEDARVHSDLVNEVERVSQLRRQGATMDFGRAQTFGKFFGSPVVAEAHVEHRRQSYFGVNSSVILRDLVRTKSGKMSEPEMHAVIFPLFFNAVVFPAFRVASGNPEIRTEWVA